MSLLFSIIIPTYNRAELIGEAIESALVQSGNDFEIIVVDDGSTDETPERLKPYSPRITLLRQSNAGPGPARNKGAQAAQGLYLVFLDSDDVWFPWTLSVLRKIIDEADRPALITSSPIEFTVFTDLVRHQLSHNQHDKIEHEYYDDFYSSSNEFRFAGSGTMAVLRQQYLGVNGFMSDVRVAEDLDLAMRLGIAQKYVFIKWPHLLAYRRHSTSQVANAKLTSEGVCFLIAQEKADQYPGGNDRRLDRYRILTRFCRSASLSALGAGELILGTAIYAGTFLWNLRLCRIRYLIAFPILLITARYRATRRKS